MHSACAVTYNTLGRVYPNIRNTALFLTFWTPKNMAYAVNIILSNQGLYWYACGRDLGVNVRFLYMTNSVQRVKIGSTIVCRGHMRVDQLLFYFSGPSSGRQYSFIYYLITRILRVTQTTVTIATSDKKKVDSPMLQLHARSIRYGRTYEELLCGSKFSELQCI